MKRILKRKHMLLKFSNRVKKNSSLAVYNLKEEYFIRLQVNMSAKVQYIFNYTQLVHTYNIYTYIH